MSEKIAPVKLKENISKNPFYSGPGDGDIWTKIFPPGRAFDQRSCPIGREFDQQQFQKFKCPGIARGGILKFQIDRYITSSSGMLFKFGMSGLSRPYRAF